MHKIGIIWHDNNNDSACLSYTVCPKKSEPLNILQQQPQICSDFNKILLTQDDICYKHY